MSSSPVAPTEAVTDHRDRRLVRTFFLTQTLGYLALFTALPVTLGPMTHDLGETRTHLALASTIAILTGAVAAVPIGRLLDRSGGRLTMTAGSVLQGLGLLGWATSDSLTQLYASFAVIGLAQAMSTYDTAFAVIVATLRDAERQKAIVAVTMVAGICTYGVSPLLGWTELMWGWRWTVAGLGLVMLFLTAPLHLAVVPGSALHRERSANSTGLGLRGVLRNRDFWLVAASLTLQTAATTALMTLLVAFLRDAGMTAMVAATMPLVVGLAQITSRLALRGPGAKVPLARICVGAFVAQALGLLLLPGAGDTVWLVALCMVAVGIGSGIGVVARPVVLADTFGTLQFATVLAVLSVPLTTARAFSPLVGAWLHDWRFPVVFGLLSLVAAAAMLPAARRSR